MQEHVSTQEKPSEGKSVRTDDLSSDQNGPFGPLPLVIGITGHRDIRDEDGAALEEKVRAIFTELRSNYPHTPLVLLSALAEGADRLATRVALDFGARLIVPLPMPKALYETDFTSDAARSEFDELLRRAQYYFELPLLTDGPAIQKQGPARDRQYAQAGAFISRQSQILIALWDGVDPKRPGGTAQTVQFKLNGVPEPYGPPENPLDPVDSGPVYHILTPRKDTLKLHGKAFSLSKHFPRGLESDAAEKTYSRIYSCMETFNSEAVRFHSRLTAERESSKKDLLSESEFESLPAALKASLKDIRDGYAVADTLAIRFQRLSAWVLNFMFALIFVAALAFQIGQELKPHKSDTKEAKVVDAGKQASQSAPAEPAQQGSHRWVYFHLGYLVLVALAYACWYLITTSLDYQNKYQDWRTLAEGLRVQFYWRMVGVRKSVADYYLRKQKSELDWIRNAIRVWSLWPAPDLEAPMPPVVTHWVRNQYLYFTRATQRDYKKKVRFGYIGYGLLGFSLVLATVQVFMETQPLWVKAISLAPFVVASFHVVKKMRGLRSKGKPQRHAHRLTASRWNKIRLRPTIFVYGLIFLGSMAIGAQAVKWLSYPKISFFTSVLTIAAGTLYGYADKRAFSAHVKQYERMRIIYTNAYVRLRNLLAADNRSAVKILLEELGKEALLENGDWILIHRERPIEVPKA